MVLYLANLLQNDTMHTPLAKVQRFADNKSPAKHTYNGSLNVQWSESKKVQIYIINKKRLQALKFIVKLQFGPKPLL